ncbi:Gfo/Idh/MocA family protein [Roseobacter sp. HKCCA0434]|uniref:Gfo/Idh/MocA family protein n=1 Tax=Roseobacter sp. HKCCA0434 TaxID=3079297 RepID=UPI002905EDFD|nr:Gfo/Idh/MocA family oxidoreductase [Roseobacter sp. HKCCA0434]
MTVTEIALVGIGKIARDQHIPAVQDNPAFRLAATVSRSGGVEGVENHATVEALLSARPDISALSLTMPPGPRYEAAACCIAAGRHTMLEKPPGATVAEVLKLDRQARAAGVTLFVTWHSRHARAADAARRWLAGRAVRSVRIDWREDVRKWHPGQDWIWRPGGLGVFDPGINALSLATAILPVELHLTAATLVFPENRDTPIAADLTFAGPEGIEATAGFDWREQGGETWQIAVETDEGPLVLTDGGARLMIDGADQPVEGPGEYPSLYRRFAELIDTGASSVDVEPLIHVADAFMLGRRVTVAPFHD